MVKLTTLLSAAALFAITFAQENKNGTQAKNQGKGQVNNANGKNNAANGQAAQAAQGNNNNNNNSNANAAQNGGADATVLSPNAIQTGSFFDGSASLGADAGQALSLTDKGNFINHCAGKTLTNGLQITTGSCNGIVMGDIPAKNKMVSTIILNPQDGQEIQEGQDFNITVQVSGLAAGSFTNAVATYYAAPQTLKDGIIVGHTHVTVQDLGSSLNPTQPLDPTQFAFFKGINDAGNGKGTLAAEVKGGLPAGKFRLCTLSSASNHQPVVMPVAQRGAQDDCTRFTVKGNGGAVNEAASNGGKAQQAAQNAQDAVNAGPGALTTSSAAAAAATSAAANAGNNNAAVNNDSKNGTANAEAQQGQKGQQGQQQQQQQGQQKQQQQQQQRQNQRLRRLARRDFVA